MSNSKIYIACHRPCDVPSDDIYTPIQVGRGVSQCSLDMIGDDTGDNISQKNSTFCEMTGQYWVWKNVHDVDYVGFCHYRRFFNLNPKEKLDSMFSDGTDVILSSPQYCRLTLQHHWLLFVSSDDFAIILRVVHNLYPEYDDVIDRYLVGAKCYPFNMFICSKVLFDEYASWIFSILFECEKHIKLSPYSRGRRVFGYIAECLMPLFFIKNKCKIKSIDVIFKSGEGDVLWRPRWQDKLISSVVGLWSRTVNKKASMYNWTHVFALHNDGIDID